MTVDYERITQDNKTEYGTAIGRIGKLFFRDTYADRTHFIFELLQNAEDAIARRAKDKEQPRSISFELTDECLRVSHFGDPFNENDVRGICGIDESTKENSLTSIGRFGIGFKSVYAFTDRPEIHSGAEHFAINSFVWPEAVPTIARNPGETVFLIPFKSSEASGCDEISDGLRKFGAQTLLFLRDINEVKWSIQTGDIGHYLRECKQLDSNVRHVTLVGQINEEEVAHEEWLTFSRQVFTDASKSAGDVEIAFSLDSESHERWSIRPIAESPLVVYFPTSRETRLGFLIQGPYRTTLSRENIPADDSWNRHLIEETAVLLRDTLRWLRDKNVLDTEVLRCLPIKSQPRSMFDPLLEATAEALSSEPLLPRLHGGYISAENALLGRTESIRQLFSSDQLSEIFAGREVSWLTGDITIDRTPDIRDYLIHELGVNEVTPETVARWLSRASGFLAKQPDAWITLLYEFLNEHPALLRSPYGRRHQLYNAPLIRLEDGHHVTAEVDDEPQAFLPSAVRTDFPTVRVAVCDTDGARAFLCSLGLKEPDLVDDVIRNVLPKYLPNSDSIGIDAGTYADDVGRILAAYVDADSYSRRNRLVALAKKAAFVRAIDAGDSTRKLLSRANDLYFPTDLLASLFAGVSGVLFVDEECDCLKGKEISRLMAECGASACLVTERFANHSRFDWQSRRQMRADAVGDDRYSYEYDVTDYSVVGLQDLLIEIPRLDADARSQRAKLLWKALGDLESDHFHGKYSWFYYSPKSFTFVSEFIESLNQSEWIPNMSGRLLRPEVVVFEDLGWKLDAFLQSQIMFKPAVVRQLAQASGIEADVLDELKSRGLTTLDDLRKAIGDHSDTGAVIRNGSINEGNAEESDLEPFAKTFSDVQTADPSPAFDNPVARPDEGPNTQQSAQLDTRQSGEFGRSGIYTRKPRTEWHPAEAARKLADRFRSMVHSDYGRRCQICSHAFMKPDGEPQVFVVHVVEPSSDSRTNHFGDLLGLCGWHYALIRYGEWLLLDPETNEPFGDSDGSPRWWRMRDYISRARQDIDEEGYSYVGLPVQFWNVYREWNSGPTTECGEIRYSIPHWKYLCELLKT